MLASAYSGTSGMGGQTVKGFLKQQFPYVSVVPALNIALHDPLYCLVCSLKLIKSSDLVVMGDDSCSRGHGFKYQRLILDGLF